MVRRMARDARRPVAWLFAATISTSLVGCSEDQVPDSTEPTTTATASSSASTELDLDGDFEGTVTANGKDLLVSCSGQGPVTVVLIAGYGESSSTFLGLVDKLATDTRVCSYDRPGTRVSEAPEKDQTFRAPRRPTSASCSTRCVPLRRTSWSRTLSEEA